MIRFYLLLPLTLAACLLEAAPAVAQTNPYTWNNPAGGNWNSAANWLDGAASPFVPPSNAATDLIFGGSTNYTATNNIGAGTFNLNSITVNNTGTTTIAAAAAGNTLTLGGTAPSIVINSGSGATTISNGIIYSVATAVTNNSSSLLTLSGAQTLTTATTFNGTGNITVSGTFSAGGYIKSGAGTLTLNGATNLNTAVTLNAGILNIGAVGTLGATGTTVTINGGTMQFRSSYTSASVLQVFSYAAGSTSTMEVGTGFTVTKLGNQLIGTTATLNKTGAGILTVGSSGTSTLGTINVNAGILQVTSNRLSSVGAVNIASGAQFRISDNSLTGVFPIASGGLYTLNGNGPSNAGALHLAATGAAGATSTIANGVVLQTDSRINMTTTGGLATIILSGSVTGAGNLTKAGTGLLVLSNASNSYGGATSTTTVLNGGLTISGGVNRLPTATTLILGDSVANTSGLFELNGLNQMVAGLTNAGTGTANQVQNLSATAAIFTVNYTGVTTQIYTGRLGASGADNFAFVKSGSGTLRLGGTNTYTGTTTVVDGTLQIDASSNRLPIATAMVLGGGTTSGTFDLNGFSQEVSSLTVSGTGTANTILNTSGTAGIITVNYTGVNPIVYSGNLGGTGGNNFGFTKQGSGTVSLTGAARTYTGTTTISAGVLKVAPYSAAGGYSVSAAATLTTLVPAVPTTFSMPSLSLDAGGTIVNFEFASSTLPLVPLMDVTSLDGLNLNGGAHTINLLSGTLLPAGTFTLIDYNNTTAITTGFTINTATLPARTTAVLTYDVPNTRIDVTVGVDSIKWNGNNNSNWDVGTAANVGGTNNWKLVSDSTATNFITGDNVTFDDTATVFTVNLTNTDPIQPSIVTVNNMTNAYVFQGTGLISGSASLTKLGSNMLTLATNNTYSGTTTVTAGTLQIGNGGTVGSLGTGNLVNNAAVIFNRSDAISFGGDISGSGSLTKSGANSLTLTGIYASTGSTSTGTGGAIILDNANSYTYSGAISGSGGITKNNANTITFTGNSNYLGTTTVNLGTLQIGNGGTSGNVTSDINLSGGSLILNRSDNFSLTGGITGTGGVTKLGNGEATVSGSFDHTGATLVSAGKLILNRTSDFNYLGGFTITANSTLETNVGVGATLTVATTMTGTATSTFIKSGLGQVSLQANNNAFTGTVIVNAGTLSLDDLSGGDLGAALITVNNGGTFIFGSGGAGNPDLPGTTVFQINVGGLVDLQVGENYGGVTLNGGEYRSSGAVLTNVNTTVVLATGYQVMSGSITTNFTGSGAGGILSGPVFEKTTTGTVTVSGTTTFQTTMPINIKNGVLEMLAANFPTSGTGLITIGDTTSATLRITDSGSAISTRNLSFATGGGSIDIANAAGSLTINGTVAGTGSVTKLGLGTLTFGSASFAPTTVNVNAGTLKLTPATLTADITVANGATFTTRNTTTATTSLSIASLTLGATGSTLAFDLNQAGNPNVALLTVTNSNGLNVNGGSHLITVTNPLVFANGVFTLIDYSGTAITSGFTLSSVTTMPPRASAALVYDTVNTTINLNVSADPIKWTGAIDANWDVGTAPNVGGTNNWKLSSDNSATNFVTGDIVIFDDSASVFTVDLTTSVLPSMVTVNSTANYTFQSASAGLIGGIASLVKQGTGTLIILTDNTNSGTTTVSNGTLQVGNGGTAGAIGTGNLINNAVVILNRSDDISFAGNISGTGSLTKSGSNNLTLTGTFTSTGPTSLPGGSLILSSSTSYAYGGAIGGLGAVTKDGSNTVTFTGSSNYSGLTTINTGTLQIGDGNTSGNITSNVSIAVGATFKLNRSDDFSIVGTVSGDGNVAKDGAGIATLINDYSYLGTTTVTNGTLVLNRTTDSTQAAAASIASGATLEVNVGTGATITWNGVLTGGPGGGFTKSGAGMLTLTADNDTFTGTVTINGGILRVQDITAGDLSATSIVVNNGGKFEFFGPTGNPDLPGTTFITINTGGIAEFSEDEAFGGINLLGGTFTLASTIPGNVTLSSTTNSILSSGSITQITPAAFAITGSSAIRKTTSGTVTVTDTPLNNTGGLFIDEGTLSTNSTIGGATGSITFGTNGGSPTAGTLLYSGSTVANTKLVTLNDGGGTVNVSSSATDFTLGGVIDGTGSLTKTGAGVLILTAANTYSNGTTVSTGTLAVNNTTGSGTGTGPVSVSNGATLRGTGLIAGATTVDMGGSLAPGNSVGTISFTSGLTLASGSLFKVEITDNATYDKVVIGSGGSINITGATLSPPTINGLYVPVVGDKFFIVDNQSAGGVTGMFTGYGQDAVVVSNVNGSGFDLAISYTADFTMNSITGGNDVALYATPEPHHIMLISTMVLGVGLLIRRRWSKKIEVAAI